MPMQPCQLVGQGQALLLMAKGVDVRVHWCAQVLQAKPSDIPAKSQTRLCHSSGQFSERPQLN